jgi:DNA invertase Pin-like site-specific DNA recombinase
MSKRIGYIRVSTPEQNPDRQLEDIPLDKKFIEFASARDRERPQLKNLIDYVREDDLVIVHSMDRLARNLRDLRAIVDELISMKVSVQFMKENLTFSGSENAMSTLMLSLMGAFAEFEYAFIRERQREGIAIAKKSGRYLGGKKKLNSEKVSYLKEQLANTRISKTELAKNLGISRFTLYKYLDEIKQQQAI